MWLAILLILACATLYYTGAYKFLGFKKNTEQQNEDISQALKPDFKVESEDKTIDIPKETIIAPNTLSLPAPKASTKEKSKKRESTSQLTQPQPDNSISSLDFIPILNATSVSTTTNSSHHGNGGNSGGGGSNRSWSDDHSSSHSSKSGGSNHSSCSSSSCSSSSCSSSSCSSSSCGSSD